MGPILHALNLWGRWIVGGWWVAYRMLVSALGPFWFLGLMALGSGARALKRAYKRASVRVWVEAWRRARKRLKESALEKPSFEGRRISYALLTSLTLFVSPQLFWSPEGWEFRQMTWTKLEQRYTIPSLKPRVCYQTCQFENFRTLKTAYFCVVDLKTKILVLHGTRAHGMCLTI